MRDERQLSATKNLLSRKKTRVTYFWRQNEGWITFFARRIQVSSRNVLCRCDFARRNFPPCATKFMICATIFMCDGKCVSSRKKADVGTEMRDGNVVLCDGKVPFCDGNLRDEISSSSSRKVLLLHISICHCRGRMQKLHSASLSLPLPLLCCEFSTFVHWVCIFDS